MRIREDIRIREVGGQKVIYGTKENGERQVLCLSGSACWLLEQLAGKDFTIEEAASLVCDNFDVDEETATRDVKETIRVLESCNLVQ